MAKLTYDVFLSYASRDTPQVEVLGHRLIAEGLKPFLDKWHLVPGEPWQEALEEALNQSRTFAVFLGPGDLGPWQNEEMREALNAQVQGKSRRVIPVLLPGASMPAEKSLPRFLWRLTWVDFRAGLNDPQALHRLVCGIKGIPPEGGPSSTSPPARTIMIGVPHRNPYFTGRESLLSLLHQQLQMQGTSALAQAALYGLGGVGKTQTAIEYVHRFGEHYLYVLWVVAEEETSIQAAYLSIARELELVNTRATMETAIPEIMAWLSQEDDWLLVFDNADDPVILRNYLPPQRTGGKVLLTSRAKSFVTVGIREPFRVETLESEASVKFLIERTGNADAKAAADLAAELDYLPLALEQAAAYIDTVGGGFAEYLARYRRQGVALLAKGKPITDYPKTVATTWILSFDAVRVASLASSELLTSAAFLAPDAVPIEIFTVGGAGFGNKRGFLLRILDRLFRWTFAGDALSKALVASGEDSLSFWELLEPLERYSLVQRLPGNAFKLHRLTQEVIKDPLGEEGCRAWTERVVRALNAVYPPAENENWDLCERLQPSARLAYNLTRKYKLKSIEAGRLFNQAGSFSSARGDHTSAKIFLELSVEVWNRLLGSDHPDTLTARNNLAVSLQASGDLVGARKIFRQILEVQEDVLGSEHPMTLQSKNNLAATLRALDDLLGAKKLHEQILEIQERLLGNEHPETTLSTWNLFLTVRELDDPAAVAQLIGKLHWLLQRDEASIPSVTQRKIRQLLLRFLNSS